MPAAKTGRIPADRIARTSSWNSKLQPAPPNAHELFTTCGASGVAGFASGSMTHCIAWWMAVAVAVPRSLKILAAIQRAPGATPTDDPPADPPTMMPIVAVPWPDRSVGVACWAYGSYHESVPPRHVAARSGSVGSTPESRLATTIPCPVKPFAQTAGAPTSAMFGSTGAGMTPAAAVGAAMTSIVSGVTLSTSGRAASAAIMAGVAVTERPLNTQNGTTLTTLPAAMPPCRTRRIGAWPASAFVRSAVITSRSRAARPPPRTGPGSAAWARRRTITVRVLAGAAAAVAAPGAPNGAKSPTWPRATAPDAPEASAAGPRVAADATEATGTTTSAPARSAPSTRAAPRCGIVTS